MVVVVDGDRYADGNQNKEEDKIGLSPEADADEEGEEKDVGNDP